MVYEVPVGQMPFPVWLIHHCVACILSAALVGNGAVYIFFMVRHFKAPEPVGLTHSQCQNTHTVSCQGFVLSQKKLCTHQTHVNSIWKLRFGALANLLNTLFDIYICV